MNTGWTPEPKKKMTTVREKLESSHQEIMDQIAAAYDECDDEFAFSLLAAAYKIAEAIQLLDDLSNALHATEDGPAAYKMNGVF